MGETMGGLRRDKVCGGLGRSGGAGMLRRCRVLLKNGRGGFESYLADRMNSQFQQMADLRMPQTIPSPKSCLLHSSIVVSPHTFEQPPRTCRDLDGLSYIGTGQIQHAQFAERFCDGLNTPV